jgi:hypothetical protein
MAQGPELLANKLLAGRRQYGVLSPFVETAAENKGEGLHQNDVRVQGVSIQKWPLKTKGLQF